VDSVALYRLRRMLRELGAKKGRGTELISLYIPPGRAIHEVMGNLREEYGTASNIKSDTTRSHVQEALVKVMQRLKLYRQVPETGLVLFCGALPTNGPGSETVFLYEIIPPKPITTYLYRCDDHFHLEPLRELLREERAIGVVSIDATSAGLGVISGSRVEVVDEVTSGVSGKHRAGGQSARRFERLREAELNEYFRRVGRHAAKAFLEDREVEGLLVSGPGPTKHDFLKGDYLDYRLKRRILGVLDTSYAGEEGVRETVGRAEDLLSGIRAMEERSLVQRFLREVSRDKPLASYGVERVVKDLLAGKVEVALVLEDVGLFLLKATCNRCGHMRQRIVAREDYVAVKQSLASTPCEKCGATDFRLEEKDIVDLLADVAEEVGSRVEVISGRTEEGAMLRSFGGVAALLRYR
jgi:peptide chain release factor subunit 1